MKNIQLIITLQELKGFGRKTVDNILKKYPDSHAETSEDVRRILHDVSIDTRIPKISNIDGAWERAQKIIQSCMDKDIEILSRFNPKYPNKLLEIEESPIILYAKGNIDALNKKCVAVVGTRQPTNDSLKSTAILVKKLCSENYVIVSGLAEGIDTEAHRSTLDNNGTTIAVLPSGIDIITPQSNEELARRILKNHGLLLSEYPPGFVAGKWSFIDRDRIQSGLSKAVFVMETNLEGGTMHTAKYCLEYNRKLFAFDNIAQGNLRLLTSYMAEKFDDKTQITIK